MLSYRKSQQASLTEKLKKKNVIHVLGVSGSGTTMARLCLSAFARVATGFLRVYRQRRPLCLSAFVRVATHQIVGAGLKTALCLSAFARVATTRAASRTCHKALPQRIRAGCDYLEILRFRVARHFATAHSCGLRRGIDGVNYNAAIFATAHSCGLRPEVKMQERERLPLPQRIRAGCDCGKAMQRTANLLREGR